MKFRDFSKEENNLYMLDYELHWLKPNYLTRNWYRCDSVNEGLLALQTNECRSVDVRIVAIEADAENKKMRISVVTWDNTLLKMLADKGFKHYQVSRLGSQYDGISELISCDFGEDEESLELARTFLHILSSESPYRLSNLLSTSSDNGRYTANIIGPKETQCIIASQIDLLAVTHHIVPPCFGDDWSRKVNVETRRLRRIEAISKQLTVKIPKVDVNPDIKPEQKPAQVKSSLNYYGMFAAGVVVGAVAALAAEAARSFERV